MPVLQLSAANTAAVLYVSDSGTDTADGQTPETPLRSVGKAIELPDKTQSSERAVRVIGIATVSAHLPTHTQAVRIEGNDAAAGLVLTRDIRINGPLSTVLSADGALSVPEAGAYAVPFSDEVFYTDSGTELTFYRDCTLDLSDVQAREESGKLFVGWVDAQGAGVTGTAFTAGTVLYARYVTYADDGSALAGAQVNRGSLKGDKRLQFRCTIDAASYGDLTETVGAVPLGIISIRSAYPGVKELTVNSTYGEHAPPIAAAHANTLRGKKTNGYSVPPRIVSPPSQS